MPQAAHAGDDNPVARPGFGHLQPLVDGNAGTKDRSNGDQVYALRDMGYVAGIGDGILCETPVYGVPAVLLPLTQSLPSGQTVFTLSAGGIEPRRADQVAFLHVSYVSAGCGDITYAFVA